jgi:hypothetical protein
MRRRVNNTEAEQMIRERLPFENKSGSWSAIDGSPNLMFGLGVGDFTDEQKEELRTASYVVYSYTTPIGWITEDGRTVVPDVGYGPTTSQHQYGTLSAWGMRQTPARGRLVIRAGGGPRRGGIDDFD